MQNVPPVPPHLHELLAAIAAALDVPLADKPADDDTAHRLMRQRASNARIIASAVLTSPNVEDVVRSAAQLRSWTSESPVTYRSWQERSSTSAPAAEDRAKPVDQAAASNRCGRCRWTFDPYDKRFDGRARHRDTPWCRRCIDNCHDGGAEHCCVICEPARYGRAATTPVFEVEPSGADSHGWDPDDPHGDVDAYERGESR